MLLRAVAHAALTLKAYKALGGKARGPGARKMQALFNCRPATPHTNIC